MANREPAFAIVKQEGAIASLIGALRVSLSADTANFSAGMTKAQRQAASSSSAISKSLGTVKASLAGFASAFSVGLLTSAIKSSLDYAGSLGEMSQQIGVSTRDLQVLRYAAGQSGVAQEELDKGLSKLTITLGQVAAGAQAPTKALNAIGISAKDLAGLDTGQAFRKIADGLAQVTDRSQRAAVEVALFGRTGAKLDTVLAGGSRGINELADAADRLGIVLSDEQIQNADVTADRLDAIKTVLQAKIAGVVSDNAASILDLANAFAKVGFEALNAIPKIINFINAAKLGAIRAQLTGVEFADMVLPNALGGETRDKTRKALRGKRAAINKSIADANMAKIMGTGLDPEWTANRRAKPGAGVGNFLASGGGGGGRSRRGGGGSDDAERKRLDAIRDAYQFDEDMRRSQMDVLRAQQDLATDYSARATIAVQLLDLDKASYTAELNNQVAMGEMSRIDADKLLANREIVNSLERQKIIADETLRTNEELADSVALAHEIARGKLQDEESLATTAAEQRDIRLRLLDLDYRAERARLALIEADESATPAAQEDARRRRAALDQGQGAAREDVMRGTRGPLEDYLKSIPQNAAEAREALEELQVRGIQGIVDGLTQAAMGAKSLGAVFKEVAREIISSLIQIAIKKAIVGALSGALGGIFKGSGPPISGKSNGGVGGSLGDYIPGLATGGSFKILGRKGVDRNIMSMNGVPVARVSRGERVNVTRDNANANGGTRAYFDLRGAVMTPDLVRQMNEIGAVATARGAQMGAAGGHRATMTQAGRQFP